MARLQSAHFRPLTNAVVSLAAGMLLTACDQAQEPAVPVQQAPAPTAGPESTGAGEYANFGPEDFASEDVVRNVVVTGGVPMGRWKEGLLFEGIEPQPWLKSAANWFPGTEEVQPEEMRITFMGTAPMLRPGQMNTSIYIELGSGDTFIFDMGEARLQIISPPVCQSIGSMIFS